jgi:hypothetical protein
MDAPVTKADADGLSRADRLVAGAGDWMLRHQGAIQRLQWGVIALYFILAAVPPFLPAPGPDARLWNNLTLFAQFVFWGVWQPFVLASIVFAGRLWCGALCPEGALSERASRYARGWATPKWMLWRGWPFAAFCSITIYGQMIGVYQRPGAALLILGGSTLGAVATGLLYARNKRVWCRYLCPVSGLFSVVAKLAPFHFRVNRDAWIDSPKPTAAQARAANCAPLIAVRTMRGASECHMCGRCSGFRGAVVLARRSPSHEIVHVAGREPRPWQTLLITFGMIGLAAGAFHWASSPWFHEARNAATAFAVAHGARWAAAPTQPWWILANAPEFGRVLTPAGGGALLAYLAAATLFFGGGALACAELANRLLGGWTAPRLHHLVQCLTPVAACVVFLGFLAMTAARLGAENLESQAVGAIRAALAAGAGFWSLYLGWRVTGLYSRRAGRRLAALAALGGATALGLAGWAAPF